VTHRLWTQAAKHVEARLTVMAATELATGGAFEMTFDSCVRGEGPDTNWNPTQIV